MFSKKATKIDEIFTFHLTLCSKRQIDVEDFVNVCGLFRKHKRYQRTYSKYVGQNLILTHRASHCSQYVCSSLDPVFTNINGKSSGNV